MNPTEAVLRVKSLEGVLKAIVDCYGVGYKSPAKCLKDMGFLIEEARELIKPAEETRGKRGRCERYGYELEA